MFRHVQYLFIISLLTAFPLRSEEMPEKNIIVTDSAVIEGASKEHKGIVSRVIEYFHQSNKRQLTRHPNFAPLGGPYYTSEKGFGIGLVIAGDYSTCHSSADIQRLTDRYSRYKKILFGRHRGNSRLSKRYTPNQLQTRLHVVQHLLLGDWLRYG